MNYEDTNHRPARGDSWRAWGRWLMGRNLCPHKWVDDYDFLASWVVVSGIGTAYTKDHVMQTMQWCPLCGATRRKPGSARPAQGTEAGTAETEGLGPVAEGDAPEGAAP